MASEIHRTTVTIKRPLLDAVKAEIARRDALGLPGDFSTIVSEALVWYLKGKSLAYPEPNATELLAAENPTPYLPKKDPSRPRKAG